MHAPSASSMSKSDTQSRITMPLLCSTPIMIFKFGAFESVLNHIYGAQINRL